MTTTQLTADPAGVSREELDRPVGGVHHDRTRSWACTRSGADRATGPAGTAGSGPDVIDQAATAVRRSPRPPARARVRRGPGHGRPGRLVVRTLRPDASRVAAVFGDEPLRPASRCTTAACSPACCPAPVPDYRLEVAYGPRAGPRSRTLIDDPYRFLPTLGEIDLHLIGEGRHERAVGGARRARPPYDDPARAGGRHVVRGLGARTPAASG